MTAKQEKFLKCLEKSLGVITTACKIAGINRSRYYSWLKQDDDFREAVEDIDNIALDFAESQLHKQIKDGSTSAVIFYLKTKGKRRGYSEYYQAEERKPEQTININYVKPDNEK